MLYANIYPSVRIVQVPELKIEKLKKSVLKFNKILISYLR